MIALNQNVAVNNYIESLLYLAKQTRNQVEWLVIAHDDPVLLRRLGSALSEESAVVLPISQSLWKSEEAEIQEAIAWALRETAITSLVFAGSSQAAVPKREPVITSEFSKLFGHDTLVDRVVKSKADLPVTQEYFSDCVTSFLTMPEVSERLESGTLCVSNLMYRADCGLFTFYDHLSGEFRSLSS